MKSSKCELFLLTLFWLWLNKENPRQSESLLFSFEARRIFRAPNHTNPLKETLFFLAQILCCHRTTNWAILTLFFFLEILDKDKDEDKDLVLATRIRVLKAENRSCWIISSEWSVHTLVSIKHHCRSVMDSYSGLPCCIYILHHLVARSEPSSPFGILWLPWTGHCTWSTLNWIIFDCRHYEGQIFMRCRRFQGCSSGG